MKLLVLTSRFPYPLEKGDKLRLYHQLRELAKYHEVTLCALCDRDVSDEDFLMVSRFCARVEIFRRSKFQVWRSVAKAVFSSMPLQVAYFFDEKQRNRIHRLVNEIQPDHIYCQLIRAASYATGLKFAKTLDFMDNYYRWTTKLSEHWSFPFANAFFRWEAKKVAAYEERMFHEFDNHTIISKQDRAAYLFEGKEKVHCVENGVDTDFFQPQPETEKTFDIAFVGNLSYVNNVEAAKYIAQKILPLVRKQLPNCRFLIAGASPGPELKKLENKNLKIQGWLDDIRDAYAWSKVFVAPIFLAVGQQNKILEAMAMGLPCVTTPHVNNAIGAVPKESILIAGSTESFVEKLVFLLKNDKEQASLSEQGLLFVRKNFSWESSVKELRDILEDSHPETEKEI